MRIPKFTIRTLILVTVGVAFLSWLVFVRLDPMYGFSREQYEDGYVLAFIMNGTGPAYMDYTNEFWSAQMGFDDGITDFRGIYQHPDVGPFSYNRTERLRDVIECIKDSDDLDPDRKKRILGEMELELEQHETIDADTDNPTGLIHEEDSVREKQCD